MADADDILIVGAGPAGSATALRLARQGHRVRLFDRSSFPRDKVCSEYLSPATLDELAALGTDAWLAPTAGAPIDGTRVITAGGRQFRGGFGPDTSRVGRALARWLLDAALLEAARAAGARIEQMRVTDLLQDQDGVSGVMTEDADGQHRRWPARLVVGADGLGSLVARRTGMRRAGRLRRIAFSAHLRGVAGLTSITEMHVDTDRYVGLNALGNDLSNVTVVIAAKHARAARGDAEGFFWRELRRFPALTDRVAHASIAREVLVTGPFDIGCRRSIGDGFLLVGDAADFFDPFTGDGIHAALVGARLAADALDGALAAPGRLRGRALRDYGRQRRRTFLGKWLLERLIGHTMRSSALFDRAVGRIEQRGLADVLIGATGNVLSPWRVLNPVFLGRMVL